MAKSDVFTIFFYVKKDREGGGQIRETRRGGLGKKLV